LKLIIVTSCTNRKRRLLVTPVQAGFAVGTTVERLASDWRRAVESHSEQSGSVLSAESLYVGRSISEAKKAAVVAGADLYIAVRADRILTTRAD
jgi:hypothetical protein